MGAHLPSNYSAVLVAALESRSPIPPRVSAICAIECIFTLAHCILLYSTLSLKGNWKNNPFKRGCDALSAPLHSVARKAKALTSSRPSGQGRKFNYRSSSVASVRHEDEEACFFDVGERDECECDCYLFCDFQLRVNSERRFGVSL